MMMTVHEVWGMVRVQGKQLNDGVGVLNAKAKVYVMAHGMRLDLEMHMQNLLEGVPKV